MIHDSIDKQVARRVLLRTDKIRILPEQILAIFDWASNCRLLATQSEAIAEFEKQKLFSTMEMVDYTYDLFAGQLPVFKIGQPVKFGGNIDDKLKLMLGCSYGLALVPFRKVLLDVYAHVDENWYASALRDFTMSIDNQIDYLITVLSSFDTANNDDRLRRFISWHTKRKYIDMSEGNEFYEIRTLQVKRKEFVDTLRAEQLGKK